MPIEYRPLTSEEAEKTYPVFEQYGVPPPNPAISRIVAAVERDDVLGFIVMQLVPHFEPMYINPEERGRVDWKRLVDVAESELATLPGAVYYAFTDSKEIGRMCRSVGMEEMPYKIWRKAVS